MLDSHEGAKWRSSSMPQIVPMNGSGHGNKKEKKENSTAALVNLSSIDSQSEIAREHGERQWHSVAVECGHDCKLP